VGRSLGNLLLVPGGGTRWEGSGRPSGRGNTANGYRRGYGNWGGGTEQGGMGQGGVSNRLGGG